MPMDPRVSAGVCALVVQNNKILMLRRKGSYAEGAISVPGGWVEFDDVSLEAAARRELSEETGLDLSEAAFEIITSSPDFLDGHGEKPDVLCVTTYLLADIAACEDLQPELLEPDKAEWVRFCSIEEVQDEYLFHGLSEILWSLVRVGVLKPESWEATQSALLDL